MVFIHATYAITEATVRIAAAWSRRVQSTDSEKGDQQRRGHRLMRSGGSADAARRAGRLVYREYRSWSCPVWVVGVGVPGERGRVGCLTVVAARVRRPESAGRGCSRA